MRYLNGFFCILLILFAAVQYNDPDFALWFSIYAMAAAWAGVAAFRRVMGSSPSWHLALVRTGAPTPEGVRFRRTLPEEQVTAAFQRDAA